MFRNNFIADTHHIKLCKRSQSNLLNNLNFSPQLPIYILENLLQLAYWLVGHQVKLQRTSGIAAMGVFGLQNVAADNLSKIL